MPHRHPEHQDLRAARLVSALGVVLLSLLAACDTERGSTLDKLSTALRGTDASPAASVFDPCREAPEDSIAAQVPSLGGTPVPGSFRCGPSEAFIAARRAANAQDKTSP